MAQEVAVTPKKELIDQIGSKLSEMLAEQVNAFPKGFNQTRFIQNCLTVLADTQNIEKCKPLSVVRTLVKGAYLGLDFFRRECYAIPYGDVVNFQTDYKGEIKLALTYGRGIKDIYAKLVQEGDDLQIGVDSGVQKLNFNPKPFNDGKLIGAFAVVVYENGTTRYETMSIKDIEDVRQKYSKIPNGPAWQKSYGEMCKKTVLRRLCKLIDLDFDNIEQQKAYEEGSDTAVHTNKEAVDAQAKKVADPFKAPAEPAKPAVEDAQIVPTPADPDAELIAALMRKHPGEELWQIKARIKESRGQA
jgi:recombination protein RecT